MRIYVTLVRSDKARRPGVPGDDMAIGRVQATFSIVVDPAARLSDLSKLINDRAWTACSDIGWMFKPVVIQDVRLEAGVTGGEVQFPSREAYEEMIVREAERI